MSTPLEAFQPRGELVLIQIDPREQTLPSGLITGINQIERPQTLWGKVLRTGRGKKITKGPLSGDYIPLDVVPGDRVCVDKSAGYVQRDEGGRELVMVRFDQLLAVEPCQQEAA